MSESSTLGQLASHDVIQLGDGYRTRSDQLAPSGYRVIRVADITNGQVNPTGNDFVHSRFARAMGAKVGLAGDVLLTTKGSVGRVALLPDFSDPVVYSPQLCFFRVLDKGVLNPRFLAFWLQGREFTTQSSHMMNNTDMAAYLSLTDLRSVEITLPDIAQQKWVVDLLGALEDKIFANIRLVGTLHNYLTMRLRLSRHPGLQSTPLAEMANFHNNRRVPLSARDREDRNGTVPYYGASGVFDYVDDALFDTPIVLVGEDGSVLQADGTPVTQYVWGPSWVNNHAHVLTGSRISTELLYVALSTSQVGELVTGAVQPKISMANLKRLELELPVGDALFSLERTVASTMSSVRILHEENRTLQKLKGSLLPEIVSGKLRVRDAERAVSEVL